MKQHKNEIKSLKKWNLYIYFPTISFKSTENVAYYSGNGNNHDVTNMSKIPNFVIMDYDKKYITGYILGDWKDAENVIQEYQVFTTMQYSGRKCSPPNFGNRGK